MADYLAKNSKEREACEYIKKAITSDSEMLYELSYYESFENLKSTPYYLELFK